METVVLRYFSMGSSISMKILVPISCAILKSTRKMWSFSFKILERSQGHQHLFTNIWHKSKSKIIISYYCSMQRICTELAFKSSPIAQL